ncbi:MAG: hypothetical protein AAGA55_11100 [Planctomycetota bacterium]
MLGWILGGIVLTVGATLIAVVWWRVGDQWADEEYKRFGHGGGRQRVDDGHRPTVINTDPTQNSDPDS